MSVSFVCVWIISSVQRASNNFDFRYCFLLTICEAISSLNGAQKFVPLAIQGGICICAVLGRRGTTLFQNVNCNFLAKITFSFLCLKKKACHKNFDESDPDPDPDVK